MIIVKRIKIDKRTLTIIIIFTMVIILFFSGYSIGKGIYKTNVNANTNIAEPILIIEKSPIIDINNIEQANYYMFKVKNYNENKITETTLMYNIELILDNGINVKLYKDDKEISLNENKTENFYFSKNSKEEHNYKIEIAKNEGDLAEDLISNIQVKIYSEQTLANN